MKTKLLTLLILSCMLLALASCSNTGPGLGDSDVSDEQANAYFTIFKDLYEKDPALNDDSIYLAVDLTNVMLENTDPLIALLEDFCDNNGYTLLLDTFDGLKEKGYIEDLWFPDGFLIAFTDAELTKDKLITSAQKWRSGLGAIGSDYTVKFKNDLWEITKIENSWIS